MAMKRAWSPVVSLEQGPEAPVAHRYSQLALYTQTTTDSCSLIEKNCAYLSCSLKHSQQFPMFEMLTR